MRFLEISKNNVDAALKIGYSSFDDPLDHKGLTETYSHYVNGSRSYYCNTTKHQISLLVYRLWYDERDCPVGISGLYEYTDMSDGRNLVWLDWFATHPSQRRKGIGRHIIRSEIQAAKNLYQDSVLILFTESDNFKARAFYESVGFVPVDEFCFEGDERPKTIYELY
jgi:GNAT superfamily N-acetyltransferase